MLGILALAASATLSPGVTQSQVAAVIDALAPGDTLTLAAGDYPGIDLDLQHKDGTGVAGTSSAHVTIAGTGDAHVIANADQFQEGMRLRTGCAFIDVKNLHLSSKGGQTQAGIFIDSGVHDVSITGNTIEDVTGIGIQAHSMSDVHDVLIEGNDIHDTGTNTGDGNNGGQGFQAGGFDPSKATTNVFHITLRHNAVHHITGQEGDCIAFLYGVYGSTIEDNVLWDCPRGVSAETENYGITVYGSGVGHYTNAADDNVVRRNLVYQSAAVQSGHSNVGIYVGPGTLVVNNVVVASNQGIAARLESEASDMRNLSVVNNTVYDATDYAFSIRGCQNADASVIVTNNAFIAVQPAGFGYRMPDPLGAMVAKANYYSGQDYAEAAAPIMNKLSSAPSAIFVNASSTIPGADFMLAAASPLVDVGDPATAPSDDFDLATRPSGAGPDVGAYELRADLSSHWALSLGLKGTAGTGTPGGGGPSSGGCGCDAAGAPSSNGWIAALGLFALRRRRR